TNSVFPPAAVAPAGARRSRRPPNAPSSMCNGHWMMKPEAIHRFGRVALIGRPNVGKSTLLNALIGTRLSIVTPKPQTTRHRILGIASRDDAQIAFIDTPGLHQGGKRGLNRQLNRVARQVPDEADVLVHVIDGMRWQGEDEDVWQLVAAQSVPCLLVVN